MSTFPSLLMMCPVCGTPATHDYVCPKPVVRRRQLRVITRSAIQRVAADDIRLGRRRSNHAKLVR